MIYIKYQTKEEFSCKVFVCYISYLTGFLSLKIKDLEANQQTRELTIHYIVYLFWLLSYINVVSYGINDLFTTHV